jgi:hypothetical protein
MDQGRTEDAEELSRAMEDSRASISETVGEIREAVTHAIDWRERVKTHPGASLGIAAGTGLIVGRWIGGKITRPDMTGHIPGEAATAWTRPSHPTSLGASQTSPRMLDGTIHRAASRAEGLVNRVIDEVADAVEAGALMPLFSRLRDFLYSSASPARRSEEWPEAETTRSSSAAERRGAPGAAAERSFTPGTSAGRAFTPSASATAGVTPGSPVGSSVTPGASAGRGVTAGTPAGWADTHAVGTPE